MKHVTSGQVEASAQVTSGSSSSICTAKSSGLPSSAGRRAKNVGHPGAPGRGWARGQWDAGPGVKKKR